MIIHIHIFNHSVCNPKSILAVRRSVYATKSHLVGACNDEIAFEAESKGIIDRFEIEITSDTLSRLAGLSHLGRYLRGIKIIS